MKYKYTLKCKQCGKEFGANRPNITCRSEECTKKRKKQQEVARKLGMSLEVYQASLEERRSHRTDIKPSKPKEKKAPETIDNTKCKTCKYRGRTAGVIACDYMLITGRARTLICPPGKDCTEYQKGNALRVKTRALYQL